MAENWGCELDLEWINNVAVNAWCVNDSVTEIPLISDKIKGIYRAAWLLKAVSCIDLTTLSGDDTWSNVKRLAYKATQPISPTVLKELEFSIRPFTTAAVCVYPSRVKDAVDVINKKCLKYELPVAAVATGFPSGLYKLRTRLMEIEDCIKDGATEIDVVVDRSLILGGHWDKLYDELKQMKRMCSQNVKMKTILAVGELGDFRNVYKASLVAMMAGSDFIKTSTGKEAVNATLPVGLVMMRAIRDYYSKTSIRVGFKAAGGIRTSEDALNWLVLVKRELGDEWLTKKLFRIGASGLLNDIDKELSSFSLQRKRRIN